jgi:hypothetical protein
MGSAAQSPVAVLISESSSDAAPSIQAFRKYDDDGTFSRGNSADLIEIYVIHHLR